MISGAASFLPRGNEQKIMRPCVSQNSYLLTKYSLFDIWFGGGKGEVHQVLHRLQNKEKPMQNNFDSPVRVNQNAFRVQHCKV